MNVKGLDVLVHLFSSFPEAVMAEHSLRSLGRLRSAAATQPPAPAAQGSATHRPAPAAQGSSAHRPVPAQPAGQNLAPSAGAAARNTLTPCIVALAQHSLVPVDTWDAATTQRLYRLRCSTRDAADSVFIGDGFSGRPLEEPRALEDIPNLVSVFLPGHDSAAGLFFSPKVSSFSITEWERGNIRVLDALSNPELPSCCILNYGGR